MEKFLKNLKQAFLMAVVFLFPLFFLPLTQEFFITAKLYFLFSACIILLLLSTIEILFLKKVSWKKNDFDIPVIVFFLTTAISTIISSPNKIQAILNPNFGLFSILTLTIFYLYLSQIRFDKFFVLRIVQVSSLILSIISIIFFFQPFKSINFPSSWQFLKLSSFTPIGTQIDLVVLLGFSIAFSLLAVFKDNASDKDQKEKIINFILLNLNFFGLCFTLYSLIKPGSNNSTTILPPFNISWFAAVEILKKPLTVLFGVGVDNFSSVFTKVKDINYNLSNLWQVNSFAVSRSTLLHIVTETGLLGFTGFSLIIWVLIKKFLPIKANLSNPLIVNMIFLLIILCIFPPSLIVFFLFYLLLALSSKSDKEVSLKLEGMWPIYSLIVLFSFGLIAVATYLAGRSYISEVYYKKSLDAYKNNNGRELYNNQKNAIILNPYIEKLKTNFSQTNLLIANNLASRIKENNQDGSQLNEQERQMFSQAIQVAIASAKDVVTLNPQKANNWENLGAVYRNIINVAQGSDGWSISSYKKAILLDPQNPIYYLNIGGIYYQMNNYDEAIKFFEQAVALKQNWANAYYNLAWSAFKKTDYARAVNSMQYVLNLINPQTSPGDYEKAQKELEEFKKMLSEGEKNSSKNNGKAELSLPSKAPEIEPKIKLPKEASPEAR